MFFIFRNLALKYHPVRTHLTAYNNLKIKRYRSLFLAATTVLFSFSAIVLFLLNVIHYCRKSTIFRHIFLLSEVILPISVEYFFINILPRERKCDLMGLV